MVQPTTVRQEIQVGIGQAGLPVAVIGRFDRDGAGGRIPYQSTASLLQASREQARSCTEIADAIRSHGHAPTEDVRQGWGCGRMSWKISRPRSSTRKWTRWRPCCDGVRRVQAARASALFFDGKPQRFVEPPAVDLAAWQAGSGIAFSTFL